MEVHFGGACQFGGWGRNGYMQVHGIHAARYGDEIELNPITSKGLSNAAHFPIPVAKIPEVIEMLRRLAAQV
jgi:hypothetical protein